jgi:hypothetical protein
MNTLQDTIAPLLALALTLAACGDDGSSAGATGTGGAGGASTSASGQGGTAAPPSKCGALCFDSGFDDGVEQDFGNGLIECLCNSGSGAVSKTACETYCATFGVPADKSYLGMDVVADDKCACDGTMP